MTAPPDSRIPPALATAAAAGPVAVGALIASRGGTPLQEGHRTTFVFVGDAEEVELRHWMDTFPPLPPLARFPGSDVWSLTIDLPERARIEYKLAVRRGGRRRLILDPLNRNRAHDPFGANSLVTGPGYLRPSWSLPRPGVPSGDLRAIEVPSVAFGPRTVTVYHPATGSSAPRPLLVAHDGPEYLEFGALATVLDNLIAAGDLDPLVAVMTDPGDRRVEYAADPRHADHVVDEVIPAVEAITSIDPARRVALGASLGGVASLHAAWRHPGTFGGLVLQSGSVVTALGGPFRRGTVFAPVVRFMADLAARPGRLPARAHLSCGRYDGLYADNLALIARLRRLGVEVAFEEAPDGHSWENWRDRLRSGLIHALPPAGVGR